jgi:quinoprotein glucose dehydrogenase
MPRVEGLPIFKPPYGRITAIDINTGEHLWWIPNGGTPESVRDHPLLQDLDIPPTGQSSHATILVTSTLMMYGEGRSGEPRFHAVDKLTGEVLATLEIPAPTSTAPMTFMHEGQQYIVLSVGGGEMPGSVIALTLEGEESGGGRGRGGFFGGGGRGAGGAADDDDSGGGRGRGPFE